MQPTMSTIDATSPSPTVGHMARPVDRLQALLPELFSPRAQTGELLLKFQLTDQVQAAISLERVVEALQVSADRITPIPNMPEATLGLMTLKGKVFWAVDLARLLAFPKVAQRSRRHEVIVIQAPSVGGSAHRGEELLLGLVVNRVRGTFRVEEEAIASPTTALGAGLLAPYMRGQVCDQQQETWLLLSVEAILGARGLSPR